MSRYAGSIDSGLTATGNATTKVVPPVADSKVIEPHQIDPLA